MITNHDPPDPGPTNTDVRSVGNTRKRTSSFKSDDHVTGLQKRPVGDIADGVPSSQTLYVDPSFDKICKYSEKNDQGPFIVHISRKTNQHNSGASLHPMRFGHFLIKNKIQHISRDGVRSSGRNRIVIQFESASAANSFLVHPALESNQYVATVPTYNITRIGVVRDIPTDLDMTDFVEATELPRECGRIIKARRLHRKSYVEGSPVWLPTQSVAVTFEGQVLPEKIYSFHNSLPVSVYNFPTVQCMNCCRYGHIKKQCRSKPRCYKCTQPHDGTECIVTQDQATCICCRGNHFATDSRCSEHKRQKDIKYTMAQQSISFFEAVKQHPRKKLYSQVISQELSQYSNNAPSHPKSSQNSLSRTQLSSKNKNVTVEPRPIRSSLAQTSNLQTPKVRNNIKGYNKDAHLALIKDYSPPEPSNGCALQSCNITPNDNLLDLLVATLSNIVTKVNDTTLPNNIAVKLQNIIDIIQNGRENQSDSDAMEY